MSEEYCDVRTPKDLIIRDEDFEGERLQLIKRFVLNNFFVAYSIGT